jgi:hypothetical protein
MTKMPSEQKFLKRHFFTGRELSFHQKCSKLGAFFRTDANEVEIKKKLKISGSAPRPRFESACC